MGISTSVKNLNYAKKKSSAHSFSPFALMIDPSKENWGSAVYFCSCVKKYRKLPSYSKSRGGKTQTGSVEAIFGLKLAKKGNFW